MGLSELMKNREFRKAFPMIDYVFTAIETDMPMDEFERGFLQVYEDYCTFLQEQEEGFMPQPVSYTSRTRETKDLHADWWDEAYTVDGHAHGKPAKDDEPGRYVERVVIYADMFGADTQSIQTRLFQGVDLSRVGEKKSAQELARQRFYLFQRMVVEITNDRGQVIPLNEDFMLRTPERDLAYIEQEINDLKKSPIPVSKDDMETAEKERANHEKQIAAGADPHLLRHPRTAETVALDDFR